jgi:hypothetical protein
VDVVVHEICAHLTKNRPMQTRFDVAGIQLAPPRVWRASGEQNLACSAFLPKLFSNLIGGRPTF